MSDRIKSTVFIALSAVVIAVCAWIQLPLLSIPYSMQSFGVFLVIGILGGRRAFFAILVYLALGALGLPVFAGFTGGLGRLFGESGGFLLSFPFIALLSSLFTFLFKGKTVFRLISMLIGQLVSYAMGAFWFWFFYARSGEAGSFLGIISVCVLPFLLFDIIKIIFASAISDRLKRILKL